MKKGIAAALAAVLVALGVCLFFSRTWAHAQLPRVETSTLEAGSVRKVFSLPGEIGAQEETAIVPDANAAYEITIEEIHVEIGEEVQAGQLLLTCRAGEEMQQDLEDAQRALEKARLETFAMTEEEKALLQTYSHWQTAADALLLHESDAELLHREQAAKDQLDRLCQTEEARQKLTTLVDKQRRLRQREEEYERLWKLNASIARVTAPTDGYVVELCTQSGGTLHTNDVLARMGSASELCVRAKLTAEQAAYYANAVSHTKCSVKLGNVELRATQPALLRDSEGIALVSPVSGALYGTKCTVEVELYSGYGLLLPRSAAQGGETQVSFYVLETRTSFFGEEDCIRRVTCDVLDVDALHILIPSDTIGMAQLVVVHWEGDLIEEMSVLRTDPEI